MRILVVQENSDLSTIWGRFLARCGFSVTLALSHEEAFDRLEEQLFDVLIFDPALAGGGLAVADMATFRNPDIKILAVTRSSFFSDSTVFDLIPNARAVLRQPVRPEDLAAYMEYFDAAGRPEAQTA